MTHYTYEIKLQSKQWTAREELAQKSKNHFSSGKVMMTVFWDRHGVILSSVKPNEELIITGDLNAEWGKIIFNSNGERLLEICELHDLKITNGYFKHKYIHMFICIHPKRNLKSIIDYARKKKYRIKDVRGTTRSDWQKLNSRGRIEAHNTSKQLAQC